MGSNTTIYSTGTVIQFGHDTLKQTIYAINRYK